MIWLGYAGLSGAIVFSMGLLAWIVGLPTESVLRLLTLSGAFLLALGLGVHLCAIALRRRPKRPPPMPIMLKQPVVQAAPKRAEPIKPAQHRPQQAAPSLAVLWPNQPAPQ